MLTNLNKYNINEVKRVNGNLYKKIITIILFSFLVFFFLNSIIAEKNYFFILLLTLTYTILIVPFFTNDDLLNPLTILIATQILSVTDVLHRYINRLYYNKANSLDVFNDDMYVLSISLILVWLIMFYIGYIFGGKKPIVLDKIKPEVPRNSWIIILVTLIISLLGFLFAVSINGGITSMFSNMSNRVALYSGAGFLKDFVALGTVGALLLLYKGYKKTSILIIILAFFGIALFGSRGPAIYYTVLPYLLFYHYMIKKISRRTLLTIGLILVGFIIVWGQYRSYGNVERLDFSLVNTIWEASSQTAMGVTLPVLLSYLENGYINHQFFDLLFNIVFAIVPRAIWLEKPAIDTTGIVGELLFGPEHWGRWVGPYGLSYLSFGWFGVIIMGLITGVVVKKLYIKLTRKTSLMYVIFYCFTIRLFIDLFSTGGQLKIVWFGLWLILLSLISYFSWKKKKVMVKT